VNLTELDLAPERPFNGAADRPAQTRSIHKRRNRAERDEHGSQAEYYQQNPSGYRELLP
jgi:hypothetical protein